MWATLTKIQHRNSRKLWDNGVTLSRNFARLDFLSWNDLKSTGLNASLQSMCTTATSTTTNEGSVATEEKHAFKAETGKLLDIMTHSVYTDKDIFLRELVSNAADALEKFRHVSSRGDDVNFSDRELKISINVDKEAGILEICDTGMGMSKEDMVENLGTIAKSGSKAFTQAKENASEDVSRNVIGQFGVGFYSAFMVGREIEVFSVPSIGSTTAYCWISEGENDFTIREAPEFAGPGTKIVIKLRDNVKDQFNDPDAIKKIVQRYSNYVGFPVNINGEQANEISAIWARDKASVTEQQYTDFYKFIAGGFQAPLWRLHFSAEVPIDLKALLFIPQMNMERLGTGRMPHGVSLYSRKVLLESNCEKMLPNWMRFFQGVVDSEDLPISLSREGMQDSRLMGSISNALTKRLIKFLKDQAKRDPEEYSNKFYAEFGGYLKEGVCSDFTNQMEIARLLRFHSSVTGKDEMTSLDEYVSRCKPEQKKIYYLMTASRKTAADSPYLEEFKKRGVEVLFVFNNIDDLVMNNLAEFEGRTFVNACTGRIEDFGENKAKVDSENENKNENEKVNAGLNKEETDELVEWFKTSFEGTIEDTCATSRLYDTPAIVVPSESVGVRRLMKNLNHQVAGIDIDSVEPQKMEINPKHPMMKQLHSMRNTHPDLALEYGETLYRSALMAAGLTDDPAELMPKFYKLLEKLTAYKES